MSSIAPPPPVTPAPPVATAPQPVSPPTDGAAKATTQGTAQNTAPPTSALAETPEPAVVTGAKQTAPQAPQPTSLAPGTVVTATLEQSPPTPPVVTTADAPDPAPAAQPQQPVVVADDGVSVPPPPSTGTQPQPAPTPTPSPTPPPLPSSTAPQPPPLPQASTPLPQTSTPAPTPQPSPLPQAQPAPVPQPAANLATLLNAAVPNAQAPATTPQAPPPQAAPPPTSLPAQPAPAPTPPPPAAPPAAQVPSALATAVRAMPVAQTLPPPPNAQPLPAQTAQPVAVPGAPTPATGAATQAAITPSGNPSGSANTGGPQQQGVSRDGQNAGANTGQSTRLSEPPATPRPGAPAPSTPLTQTQTPATVTGSAIPSAGGQTVIGNANQLAGAPVLALRPGTALLLQVTEMTPRVPGAAPPPQQGLTLTAQGGVMSFGATVMGSTLGGQPIVETPLGLFTLGAKVALPEGTRLQLRMMQPPGTATAGQVGGQPATLMELSHQWTALDEALATLRAIDPKAAQTVLDQTIAKPGSHLAGGLAFFLVALRGGGDLKKWLGESSVQALEKSGRGKLVQRLSEEFREMAKAGSAESAPTAEWRPMFMPVFDGDGIRQLRLFVHRDAEADADDDRPPGKRFLVEADFTRLGQFQLDGLAEGKRLDLIVRTKQALPGEITKNINAIFTRSLDAAGFAGKLRFEAGVKMVTPDPEEMYGQAPRVSA